MICDDAELTLALASMGDVDAAQLREAREHAQTCARCAVAERDYAEMLDMIAVAAIPDAPSPELRRRILDAVAGQTDVPAAPRPTRTSRAQPGAVDDDAQRPWWRRLWERVPSGRPLTAFGFAAGAAAVALAAVLVFTSRGLAPVVTQSVQAGVNQPGLTGTLSYYRSTADAVVTLRGLASAPHTATGAPGVYELWLLQGSGAPIPAGTLTEQPDGTWRAVVHRQAQADTAVAATLEPAPGTQAPTGDTVFQAALPQS